MAYSKKETDAMQELKSRLKGDMDSNLCKDENLFYRFLKVQSFNVDVAEKILRNHLQWRKKYDINNIENHKHPEVLVKYLNLPKIGYDKEGCIVRYMPTGNTDWIGLSASCKLEDMTRRVAWYVEQDLIDMKQKGEKLGKTLDKVTYIHNLENLSFAQATDKKVIYNFIYLLNEWQNNYPETLKSICVIKASVYFEILFGILKKFLPSAIIERIFVYSDDTWKEEFLKNIDAEILPAFLGGTRTDPDGNPLCLSFINHGDPVPEKYYIHRSKRSLANEPGVEKISLSRAAFHEVVLEVKEPDSYLEWEFEVQSRDTGFGLFYQDEEGNKIELVPLQRINTDDYSENGLYQCDKLGTYIVVFDNTYSLIRSKVIYYKIKVTSGKEVASGIN